MVVKRDSSREPFDRAKLLRGLIVATAKRNVTPQQLEALIDGIETEMHNAFSYEVSAKHLGDMVLKRLLEVDKVAYIRFASVYKQFQDLDEFTSELKKL